HRGRNGVVPCVVPGSRELLYVPQQDFYECYQFFCEAKAVRRELAFFLGQLRPCDIFYDVGGYRGAYACSAKIGLQDDVTVHVFEPVAKNVEAIRSIAKLNHFLDFEILPVAVADTSVLNAAFNPQSSMFWVGNGQAASAASDIPAVALDDYVA